MFLLDGIKHANVDLKDWRMPYYCFILALLTGHIDYVVYTDVWRQGLWGVPMQTGRVITYASR